MKEKLNRILEADRAAGAEVVLGAGEPVVSFALLEKKRSRVSISSSQSGRALNDLTIPAGAPLCISVSGKGIIHKKVFASGEENEAFLLQKILPNANPNDFYIQCVPAANDHVFISVARKNVIDDLLKELASKKLEVISCTFGPFAIAVILPAMQLSSMVSQNILLPGHNLTIGGTEIENYAPSLEPGMTSIRAGEENLRADIAIAYASAISYFTGSEIKVDIPAIRVQADELRQKTIFKKSGAAMLVFFFALLLTNYFAFDHYWKKKQKFESQISVNQGTLQKYNELKASYDEKRKFLEETGLLRSSRSSFYADQVALDIPEAILLTDLTIQPKIKGPDERVVQFDPNTIHVSGTCKRSNELNDWIKLIKNKSWVSEVSLVNYKQDKNDPTGAFTLELTIK